MPSLINIRDDSSLFSLISPDIRIIDLCVQHPLATNKNIFFFWLITVIIPQIVINYCFFNSKNKKQNVFIFIKYSDINREFSKPQPTYILSELLFTIISWKFTTTKDKVNGFPFQIKIMV